MMLVRYDENEAVFKRTRAERLFCGGLLMFLTCLLSLGAADTYRGGAAQRNQLPLYFVMLFVLAPLLGYLAGPNEMRFDFRRKRYQSKTGFLFLSWTRSGDLSEIDSIGVWNTLRFTGLTPQWKNTKRTASSFVSCETGSEAQALAERLGMSLGIPVKAGSRRYIKKSIR